MIEKNLKKLLKVVGEEPDHTRVHQLRLVLREARASAKFLGVKQPLQKLKKPFKQLGHLRDLDVALLNAEEYGLDPSEIKKKREKQIKRVTHILDKTEQKKIVKTLKEIKVASRKTSRDQTRASILTLEKELRRWQNGKLQRNNLHEFRLTLKKTRFVLKMIQAPTEKIKYLQDTLGTVHDLEVLKELTHKKKSVEDLRKVKSQEAIALSGQVLHTTLVALENFVKKLETSKDQADPRRTPLRASVG